jgi:hypothetical protein
MYYVPNCNKRGFKYCIITLTAKLLTTVTLSFVITVLILLEHLQTSPWKMTLTSVYHQPGQTFLSIGVILYFPCKAL